MTRPQLIISVVIPTRHRNADLARCLESLAPERQTTPAESYEVIVADAGSESTAGPMVGLRFPWVRHVAAPGAWPGANRNRGATAALGEWIAFIDDDCVASCVHLEALTKAARPGIAMIEGRITCPDRIDRLRWICPDNGRGGYFWTANLAVERGAFLHLGGFDEDFERGEDLEFAHRFRVAGMNSVFAPEMAVEHPRQRLSLRSFARRTLQDRWRLLLKIKTGQSAPPDAPLPIAAVSLAADECVNLLRLSWHLFSRDDPATRRTRWLAVSWRWITIPAMLPYLMFWELRFRRRLRARITPGSA